jgi:hypothetical protein
MSVHLDPPETRALFYASLMLYIEMHGPFESPIRSILGLPMKILSDSGSKNHAEKVKRWLKGRQTWVGDASLVP